MRRTVLRKSLSTSWSPTRQEIALHDLPIKRAFPLLAYNNLLNKSHKFHKDYTGRKAFDEHDHPLPVVGSRWSEFSTAYRWTWWDKRLNPVLLSKDQLLPSEQYMGMTSGRLFPNSGWRRVGRSWKFGSKSIGIDKFGYRRGSWEEQRKTPIWRVVPRLTAIGPQARHEGKLTYTDVPLTSILFAIDAGRLNPNETITLSSLLRARVIRERDVCWPGWLCSCSPTEIPAAIPYPLKLEAQRFTPHAIKVIEAAGGHVTATYLSAEGIYQEVRPEEYPVFLTQQLPDRLSFDEVMKNSTTRGFLSQWYMEEGTKAHPKAGRRLSHYVVPPTPRDFPATFEEYERVKHHQKWHLGQPGSGTVVPFHPRLATEENRPLTMKL